VIWFLANTLTKGVAIEGEEHIPASGPFILAMNHLSFLDAPMICIAMPHILYLLAGERYANHIFTPILKIAGCIFVRRGEIDREALRQATAALQDGHILAVAVEGTRSTSGGLAEGKTGAAYLATRANVPILPAAIWGTEKVGPDWHHYRRGSVSHVRFGPVFSFPDGRARSEDLTKYTDEIMTTIAALLPEQYRGVYRDHPAVKKKIEKKAGAG
jgi:1-acyl-sn-glycerol-3-phosphate acyltransferase